MIYHETDILVLRTLTSLAIASHSGLMLLGLVLGVTAPLCLVLLQLFDTMDPAVYYAANALSGLVSWTNLALSSLSDVMPPLWRAPAFGLVLAGLSLGLAFSPLLVVFLSHLDTLFFALGTALAVTEEAIQVLSTWRVPQTRR